MPPTGDRRGTRGAPPFGGAPPGPRGVPPDPTPTVEEIAPKLTLTEAHAPVVRSILEAPAQERSEILSKAMERPDPSARERIEGDLANLEARTERMLAPALTEEQLSVYRDLIERARLERVRLKEEAASREGGPPGGRPGPPGRS